MVQANTFSMELPFIKMHGLGNDFVIVDLRDCPDPLTGTLAQLIGHRHLGVGFDQLAAIYKSVDDGVAARLKFWNSDGSLSTTCGNATRCIGELLMQEAGVMALTVQSDFGTLAVRRLKGGHVCVNMGQPQLGWQDIPLAREVDTLHLPLDFTPSATNMGNPHCSYFFDDIDRIDLADIGARTETDALFPERTNVQIVQRLDRRNLRVRVWERGVGITMASGSSACAVVVAANRRGIAERQASVHLDGGTLDIDWRDDGVWMAGPTTHVFSGVLSAEFLAQCHDDPSSDGQLNNGSM